MRLLICFLLLMLPILAVSSTSEVKTMFNDYLDGYNKGDLKKVSGYLSQEVIEDWGGLKSIETNLKSNKMSKVKIKDELIIRQGQIDKTLYFIKVKSNGVESHQEYIVQKINNKYVIKGTIGDSE